jgi:hypothetical protein
MEPNPVPVPRSYRAKISELKVNKRNSRIDNAEYYQAKKHAPEGGRSHENRRVHEALKPVQFLLEQRDGQRTERQSHMPWFEKRKPLVSMEHLSQHGDAFGQIGGAEKDPSDKHEQEGKKGAEGI